MGFQTRPEAEAYMSANAATSLGAVHFVEGVGGKLEYILQSSSVVSICDSMEWDNSFGINALSLQQVACWCQQPFPSSTAA